MRYCFRLENFLKVKIECNIVFDLNLGREWKIRIMSFQLKKLFEFILLEKSTV